MTTIKLQTIIKAPIENTFDAARNIDLHLKSAQHTNEKVIAGRTSGLIELNETVTWRGKHFGIYLTHQSKITAFEFPTMFVDQIIKGHFKYFKHQHLFKQNASNTRMIDILEYQPGYGFLGKIFDRLILKKYLIRFITTRNLAINTYLEKK